MKSENAQIPLPKSWTIHVRSAILHAISLAQFATAYTRSWAANSINSHIRLKAERDQALQELARVREEIRIKDARMAAITPHRRPHYSPTERLAILELKAARGWPLEQTLPMKGRGCTCCHLDAWVGCDVWTIELRGEGA